LNISKQFDRQTLLLRISGELDMQTSETLRQTIDSEIERRGIRQVMLNLKDVSFIDSSGLGVILGRYKKLTALGGALVITNAQPHVLKIMELSGLAKIIRFYTDETLAFEEGRGAS
jgi:stage II sporulation protein AA (anti-sigma F factor antagonist)